MLKISTIALATALSAATASTSPTFAQGSCTISVTCSTTMQPGQPPATTCSATLTCPVGGGRKK